MSQANLQEKNPEFPTRINPRILLLALGMFALGTDAFIVAGVLPVIARETGVTAGLVGQLITVFSLTYGLGAPVLAALTGRWPRNLVLIGSLGLLGLANLASALSPSFPLLLLTRILAGCFAATYAPMAYTAGISLAPPAKRGMALALVVIGLTTATALGAPLGTWIGTHFGWRFSFGMVAVLAIGICLLLVLSKLPQAEPPTHLSLQERLRPITQPRVLLVLLPCLLWNIGINITYSYIALLLQFNLHISDVSLLLVFFGLGIVTGNWIGGFLVDRFGPRRLLLILPLGLSLTQFLLPLLIANSISGAIMLFLWGLSGSMLFIPQQQRVLQTAPEHANVLLALNNSALYLGIAGGAAVGGLALPLSGITHLPWLGVIAVLIALLIIAITLYLGRKQTSTDEHGEDEREKAAMTHIG